MVKQQILTRHNLKSSRRGQQNQAVKFLENALHNNLRIGFVFVSTKSLISQI